MPSPRHEALVHLFRSHPSLAPELLRDALHAELPVYSEIRIESAGLSELRAPEHHADLMLLLYDGLARQFQGVPSGPFETAPKSGASCP